MMVAKRMKRRECMIEREEGVLYRRRTRPDEGTETKNRTGKTKRVACTERGLPEGGGHGSEGLKYLCTSQGLSYLDPSSGLGTPSSEPWKRTMTWDRSARTGNRR